MLSTAKKLWFYFRDTDLWQFKSRIVTHPGTDYNKSKNDIAEVAKRISAKCQMIEICHPAALIVLYFH